MPLCRPVPAARNGVSPIATKPVRPARASQLLAPSTLGELPLGPRRRLFHPEDIAGFNQLRAMGVEIPPDGRDLMPPWHARHPALPSDFETAAEMQLERQRRIQYLGRDGSEPALALVERLKRLDRGTGLPPATLACPLFSRWARIRFFAAVMAWLMKQQREQLHLVTLICPAMFVAPGELWTPDNPRALIPGRLHNLFRKHLNQAGANRGGGWLIAGLDASFEASPSGCHTGYQFHLHGIANDAMLPAVERLRKSHPAYRRTEWVHRPVDDKPIDEVAGAITYLVKGHWVQRNSRDAREFGEFVTRRSRLPTSQHTEMLMWRNLQKFGDMFRMFRCRPRDLPRFVRGNSW